jgi:hypothetical protein
VPEADQEGVGVVARSEREAFRSALLPTPYFIYNSGQALQPIEIIYVGGHMLRSVLCACLLAAEVFIGVPTLVGTFWLDPATRTFLSTPTRMFTGALSDFGPIDLVNLASGAGLSGPYWWFTLVDADANGVPNGTFADVVLTVVPRP